MTDERRIIVPGQIEVGLDRHPLWEGESQRVTLVERVDKKGLGVAKRGGRFICALPDGYDGLSQVHMMTNGQVIVWHPNLPTLVCDFATGKTAKADIPPEFYFRDARR